MERHLTEEPLWYLKSIRYWDYVNSDHWKLLRERYITEVLKDEPRCERCGIRWIGHQKYLVSDKPEEGGYKEFELRPRPPKFNLHHKTYERLGEEELEDLELLCVMCHNLEHIPQSKAAQHWAELIGTERVFPLVIEPW